MKYLTNLFSKFQSKNLKKYIANTSWLFFERITRIVLGVFVGIYVARYLGPNHFGILCFANSYVGIFIILSSLGLNDIVIQGLVNEEDQRDLLLGTSFFLKLTGAIFSIFILMISIQFTSSDANTKLIVFIIACGMIFQSFNVIDLYFQAKVLSKYIVWSQLATLLISSIAKLVLIFFQKPLIWFAIIVLIDSIVLAANMTIYYFYSKLSLTKWKFSINTSKYLLKKSWKLILSGIAVSIYVKIDQVMIKEMISNEAVGNYSAALRLSEAWYFIPMAVSSSLFPAIISAKKINDKLYYDRLQKLFDFLAWIAILIALPISILSDWILITLFGTAYQDGGSVLAIHIWTGVFVSLGLPSGNWYIIENYITKYFYRTVAGLATNIILNIMLIPKYGITGAAYAMLISQFVSCYFYDAFQKETRILFKMKTMAIIPIHRLNLLTHIKNLKTISYDHPT